MSHGYTTVQWNRNKRFYDLAIVVGVVAFVVVYMAVAMTRWTGPQALSPEIVMIRALAACAFAMLTIILCIGPLARLSPRFLPLLYNRRHLGVSFFIVALAHGGLATVWYHGFGEVNPVVSIYTSDGRFDSLPGFPFQPLGSLALIVFFLMAATSHDYWNANLGAPVWKALHMGVYGAYGLVIGHIALGALQSEFSGLTPIFAAGSLALVAGLHLTAGLASWRRDSTGLEPADWVDVGSWRDIPDGRAIGVQIGSGERIAVFRYDGSKIAAVGNACQHQNGPLCEGRVIDGAITCPWHGFQYRPEDGASPPPFTEKIPTYQVRLDGDRVQVNPTALPPGTPRPVARVHQEQADV